jgi:hypothetical protein
MCNNLHQDDMLIHAVQNASHHSKETDTLSDMDAVDKQDPSDYGKIVDWNKVEQLMQGKRSSNQCRHRWKNYVKHHNMTIHAGPWTPVEVHT